MTVPIALLLVAGIAAAGTWLVLRTQGVERRRARLEVQLGTLYETSSALACAQEVAEACDLAARAAQRIFDANRALVLLEDPNGTLHATGEANWQGSTVTAALEREGMEVVREHLRRPDGISLDPASIQRLATALETEALEVLPLRGSREAIGVLFVAFDAPRSASDASTTHTAQVLATQTALALERLRTAENALEAPLRDALTAMGNRRKAQAALEVLKEDDAIAVIDLDRFDEVNETYGSAAGDRVLRTMAEFLRNSIREPDEVFRFGGQEFLLVLPGAGSVGSQALQRIHQAWQVQKRVTSFSAGVAIHDEADDAQQTLARAKLALSAAKREGRDRVVPYRAELDAELSEEA